MKKLLKFIFGLIRFLVTLTFLAFIAVVCLQKFSNNQIAIFNYRMFSVLTGSMEPDYKVGDILISKEIEPEKLKIGDDITYIGNTNSFKGKTVTHRIVKIEKDPADGQISYFTQGTNNSVIDPPFKKEQILGKVVYRTVILSALFKIVATKVGMFLLIVIPIMFIIMTEIIQTLLEKETKKRNS